MRTDKVGKVIEGKTGFTCISLSTFWEYSSYFFVFLYKEDGTSFTDKPYRIHVRIRFWATLLNASKQKQSSSTGTQSEKPEAKNDIKAETHLFIPLRQVIDWPPRLFIKACIARKDKSLAITCNRCLSPRRRRGAIRSVNVHLSSSNTKWRTSLLPIWRFHKNPAVFLIHRCLSKRNCQIPSTQRFGLATQKKSTANWSTVYFSLDENPEVLVASKVSKFYKINYNFLCQCCDLFHNNTWCCSPTLPTTNPFEVTKVDKSQSYAST